MTTVSPWISRFEHIQSENDVASLSKFVPSPLTDLHLCNIEVACGNLERNFDQLFIPTSNTNSILKKMHDLAAAHATAVYPDSKTYLKGIYSENELRNETRPFFLTGPAGVGKSHIIKAYQRIKPQDSFVHLDGHGKFVMNAAWSIGIKEKISPQLALQRLVQRAEAETKKGLSVKECQRIAYRDGISLLLLDELQFLSQSKASTLITSLLTIFTYIGLPTIFVANFSLGHKLKKRAQESKQRFLSHPLLLLPDPPESQDWQDTLLGYVDIAPETFQIDSVESALTIHNWCAGLKRLLKDLFLIAYRTARADNRKIVNINDFKSAYLSTEYSEHRLDVRDMQTQALNGAPEKRLDLYCPFELPPSRAAADKERAREARLTEASEQIREQNLSIAERKALKSHENSKAKEERQRNTLRVGKNKTPVSLDAFRKGDDIFLQQQK